MPALRVEVSAMLGKRLGDDQDASTRPKRDGRLRPAVGSGGKAAVELMQPRDCDCAVSLRDGIERSVKLHGRRQGLEPRGEAG